MSHSKPSTTTFQPSYVHEFPWVREDPSSNTSAICSWCKTKINISGMGKTALKSHSKSNKHTLNEKNIRKSLPLGMFFKNTVQANPLPGPSSLSCHTTTGTSTSCTVTSQTCDKDQSVSESQTPQEYTAKSQQKTVVKQYMLTESVTKSEIFWCLQIVVNHIPFRTAERCTEGFKTQFPDSEIASKIQLKRTKIGYMVVFGLAPFFEKQLIKTIDDCPQLVLCFDESLNKISQKQQMDLHLRF
jgi:hypothetical protein